MRTTRGSIVVPVLLFLSLPAMAEGQARAAGAEAGFWRWALGAVRDGGTSRRPTPAARGRRGPAFCRSGVGHPVHGRAWCLRKGFSVGSVPWVRVRLGGLQLWESDRPRRFDGRLGASDLQAILGEATLERLLQRAGIDRSTSFLNGRWQELAGPSDARILQVRIVDRPLAEINDLDADGNVEEVLLYRPDRR